MYDKNKYDRHKITKKGIVTTIYKTQRQSSKRRGQEMPSYSKEWLSKWLFGNPEFHRLYDLWAISGYKKDLKPSIDRIDDYKGYSFDNIQLMTWKQNNLKGRLDIRSKKLKNKGLLHGGHKAVRQYKKGVFIKEYISIAEACRENGLEKANVHKSCNSNHKSGGFKWEYAT